MRSCGAALLVLIGWFSVLAAAPANAWTEKEITSLRALWIGSLPAPPPDRGNPVADDPRAAEFGHRLFFDTRLSAGGAVACATCHAPERAFTDGRPTARGIGAMTRNAPSVIGAAWSPWLFWDGRKDSLWSQALDPLESPVEHGMTRARVVALIAADADYRRRYIALFGPLPDPADRAAAARAFANAGRAIAAYERTLRPGETRFDRYVGAILGGVEPAPADRLRPDELDGLRIFIDEARGQCIRCHSGPLFTDHRFHNTGVDEGIGGTAERDAEGRPAGFRRMLADEFACLGPYSGAPPGICADVQTESAASAVPGGFKTPGLRNVARTAPYMRTGRFASLGEVLRHYREAPPARLGRTELEKLPLTDAELEQLRAFLLTLDAPPHAPARYLAPPAVE